MGDEPNKPFRAAGQPCRPNPHPFQDASSVQKGSITTLDAAAGRSRWMTLFPLRKTYTSFWEARHPPRKHQPVFQQESTSIAGYRGTEHGFVPPPYGNGQNPKQGISKPSEMFSDPYGSSNKSSGSLSHALRCWKKPFGFISHPFGMCSLTLRFVFTNLAESPSFPFGKRQLPLAKHCNLERLRCFPLQVFQPPFQAIDQPV